MTIERKRRSAHPSQPGDGAGRATQDGPAIRVRLPGLAAGVATICLPGLAVAEPAVFFDYNLDEGRDRFQEVLGEATAPGDDTVEVFEYNFWGDNGDYNFYDNGSPSQDVLSVTGDRGTEVTVDLFSSDPGLTDYMFNQGDVGIEETSVTYSGDTGEEIWRNLVTDGFGLQFSDADTGDPITMNAVGMEVSDWGTCCTDGTNVLPDGQTYDEAGEEAGTAVYAVFDAYSFDEDGDPDLSTVQTGIDNPNINLIGNITDDSDTVDGRGPLSGSTDPEVTGTFADGSVNDNNHFVAAVNDTNLFDNVAFVPNGAGELFGYGGILYFARVEPGSVPGGSSSVGLGSTQPPPEDVRPGTRPERETVAEQSILERVLASSQETSGKVTGLSANTASNLDAEDAVFLRDDNRVTIVLASADGAGDVTFTEVEAVYDAATGAWIDPVTGDAYDTVQNADDLSAGDTDKVVLGVMLSEGDNLYSDGSGAFYAFDPYRLAEAGGDEGLLAGLTEGRFATDVTSGIDGSITNVASQIDEATASVGDDVNAVQSVTASFGNMATTALGAVNTGEIGLGTNQEVEEAIADTSEAVRSTISQVGTNTGETVLAVNSALNTMGINGSIENTFDGVNASVAAVSPDQLGIISDGGAIELAGLDGLLGSMETTVLGAVNTGTIVSGVNNRVAGTVAGITGNSGTNMFEE